MTDTANVKDDFVAQWGALGSQWGINRTMAMIHALLLVSPAPLNTDQIMDSLAVSRGNANTNIRDLVGWGLVRQVVVKGERKDHYEAEKDVWKIFCTVARERKRREIEPASKVLEDCIQRSKNIKTAEGRELSKQLTALNEFVTLASVMMEKIAAKDQSVLIPKLLKLLS
jgi:DNA-binding transcriptional regulator GbsR (MarR family)